MNGESIRNITRLKFGVLYQAKVWDRLNKILTSQFFNLLGFVLPNREVKNLGRRSHTFASELPVKKYNSGLNYKKIFFWFERKSFHHIHNLFQGHSNDVSLDGSSDKECWRNCPNPRFQRFCITLVPINKFFSLMRRIRSTVFTPKKSIPKLTNWVVKNL